MNVFLSLAATDIEPNFFSEREKMMLSNEPQSRAALEMPNPSKGYMDAAYGDYYEVQEKINKFLWSTAELERQARLVLDRADELKTIHAALNTVMRQSGVPAFAQALVRTAMSARAKEIKNAASGDSGSSEYSETILE